MVVNNDIFREARKYVAYIREHKVFLEQIASHPQSENLIGEDFRLLLQECSLLISQLKQIEIQTDEFYRYMNEESRLESFTVELKKFNLDSHSSKKFIKLKEELFLAYHEFKESAELFSTVESTTMKKLSQFFVQKSLTESLDGSIPTAIKTFFEAFQRLDNSLEKYAIIVMHFSIFVNFFQNAVTEEREKAKQAYAVLSEEYTVLHECMSRMMSWGFR